MCVRSTQEINNTEKSSFYLICCGVRLANLWWFWAVSGSEICVGHVEGSVTQRRNSILAILRKSGSCVIEHLGLIKDLSLFVSLAIELKRVLGGVKSLCFLESPHFSEHLYIKYSFWQNSKIRLCVTEPSMYEVRRQVWSSLLSTLGDILQLRCILISGCISTKP